MPRLSCSTLAVVWCCCDGVVVMVCRVQGLWYMCRGEKTPWGTHIGGEEYPPDTRVITRPAPCSVQPTVVGSTEHSAGAIFSTYYVVVPSAAFHLPEWSPAVCSAVNATQPRFLGLDWPVHCCHGVSCAGREYEEVFLPCNNATDYCGYAASWYGQGKQALCRQRACLHIMPGSDSCNCISRWHRRAKHTRAHVQHNICIRVLQLQCVHDLAGVLDFARWYGFYSGAEAVNQSRASLSGSNLQTFKEKFR